MNTYKNKGFTLVELVVVMSIISLLASIVLVNFNGYFAKARDAKRISDLAAVMQALIMYRADHGTFCVDAGAGGWGWLSGDYGYGSVANRLVNLKYLVSEPLDPQQGIYGYMIACWPDHVALWATLEGPSTLNCNNVGYEGYNGSYGKNYCIFQ